MCTTVILWHVCSTRSLAGTPGLVACYGQGVLVWRPGWRQALPGMHRKVCVMHRKPVSSPVRVAVCPTLCDIPCDGTTLCMAAILVVMMLCVLGCRQAFAGSCRSSRVMCLCARVYTAKQIACVWLLVDSGSSLFQYGIQYAQVNASRQFAQARSVTVANHVCPSH